MRVPQEQIEDRPNSPEAFPDVRAAFFANMTADELAERSGASIEYVSTLIELGIVSGGGAKQSFSVSDIQRVRLARELEQSGIAIEAIGEAVASGHLSFEFVDAIFPNPPAVGTKTLREVSAELDLSLQAIARLYAMWGLARPGPDEAIREDDAAVFSELAAFPAKSYPHDVLVHAARPVGEMAHRIADLAFDFFRAHVEAPMLASGVTLQQIMDSTGALVQSGASRTPSRRTLASSPPSGRSSSCPRM